MTDQIKINWYRCKVDKALMSELMRKSDARGFAQVIPQLLLFAFTGTIAYIAFLNVHKYNWKWSLPLLLLALFVHGTFSCFCGGSPCHELSHKTPFKSQRWNEFFLKLFGFLGWWDPVAYRISHVKHHQVTVHDDHDGEVELPMGLDWYGVKFFTAIFTVRLRFIVSLIGQYIAIAGGDISHDGIFKAAWLKKILDGASEETRREHRNWARTLIFGHLALAILFVATGHWFLIVIVNFGCMYCTWFRLACGATQHIGMTPNVPDFRLCTRTFTCSWLPAFLYWNMQYHVEHHMFPAVPFYNLPRLRKAIESDLPPATHGLWATWKQILPILRKQRKDPTYTYVPVLPNGDGERVGDAILHLEAAQPAG
jgi:fatty acid desaturase